MKNYIEIADKKLLDFHVMVARKYQDLTGKSKDNLERYTQDASGYSCS